MSTPLCPLLKKPCIEHQCAFFTHIIGMHPQTGKELDQWDCSVRWLPVLITEGARQTHNAVAAIESMRNETVQRQDALFNAVTDARSHHEGHYIASYPNGPDGPGHAKYIPGPDEGYDAGGELNSSRDNHR